MLNSILVQYHYPITYWPVVKSFLKFCTEHDIITTVLCTQFQNDWVNEKRVKGKRDFTRFGFKMSFGWISYIAQPPVSRSFNCTMSKYVVLMRQRSIAMWLYGRGTVQVRQLPMALDWSKFSMGFQVNTCRVAGYPFFPILFPSSLLFHTTSYFPACR